MRVKEFMISVLITVLFFACLSYSHNVIQDYFRVNVPSGSMLDTIPLSTQLLIKKDTSNLQRGSIIVFYHDDELMIKRLIGLPGDVVDIREGVVYVNGVQLAEDYVSSENYFTGTFIVPDESYFVLGDNRGDSLDSRYWNNSYVNYSDIVGYAVYYIYPKIRRVDFIDYGVL